MYVTDTDNDRIQVFDAAGNFLRKWSVRDPSGIALDASGAVYVADERNARIQVFDAQGNFLREWGEFGSGDGQFRSLLAA